MKKKFVLIVFIGFIGLNLFAQSADSVDITEVDVKNTTSLSPISYFPYFEMDEDTTMYRISAEYLMPWVKNGTSVYGRSTSYNYVFGGTAAVGKVTNYGTWYQLDDATISGGKKLYWGDGSYAMGQGNVLYLYDPTTGLKSLADLVAGGNGLPDGWESHGDTTLYGTINSVGDTAIFIDANASSGVGILIDNDGYLGVGVINGGSDDVGFSVIEAAGGTGYSATNNSTGTSFNSLESANGNHFVARNSSDTIFLVGADSVYFPRYADADNPTWIVITVSGAIDTGTLEGADYALDMDILTAVQRLNDRYNGEIAFYYKDKQGIHKVYGVHNAPGPMKQIQSIVSGVEMNTVNIADVETAISELKLDFERQKDRIYDLEMQNIALKAEIENIYNLLDQRKALRKFLKKSDR